MNEYIIKSWGYRDEIISADMEAEAVFLYKDRHPEREVTEVLFSEPL